MSEVDTAALRALAVKAAGGTRADKDAWLDEMDWHGVALCDEVDRLRAEVQSAGAEALRGAARAMAVLNGFTMTPAEIAAWLRETADELIDGSAS